MKKRLKKFRVLFTDTRDMRIDLRARSANAAMSTAHRLYIHGNPNDSRFIDVGGDAFHDATAEEV